MPHALWRPQMITFLMRQGIDNDEYQEEIPDWTALAQLASDSKRQNRLYLVAKALGRNPEAPFKEESKKDDMTDEERKAITNMINMSKKAYGYLYAALPAELRPLVADVPQGYAYGIWSFLEKKFRSTELDSVMQLWTELTRLEQESEETHDIYKARVDSVVELLKNAQKTVDPGLYASLLLWRLQPSYATAVLTLKTSERLKDPDKIDWVFVAQYMSEYERSQLGLGSNGEPRGSRPRHGCPR